MMKRDAALSLLAQHYPDGIVVPVYQAAFDWMAIRPHPLNYLCTGAMGQGSSHALGLALGCPEETVVVLDGDGSLLMNLGSLVTIAATAPKNLIHMLVYNGLYEVNGRYPVPGGRDLDFAAFAKGAGYAQVFDMRELDQFAEVLPTILSASGPVFVVLHVEQGEVYPKDYVAIHSAESRGRFRQALRARLAG